MEGTGGWSQKVVLWLRMCQSNGIPTREKVLIRFSTYNICNGRNGEFYSELREMSQVNMDLGIFQETKVLDRIYTHRLSGCVP